MMKYCDSVLTSLAGASATLKGGRLEDEAHFMLPPAASQGPPPTTTTTTPSALLNHPPR